MTKAQTIGKEVNNRMSREPFRAIVVSLNPDVEKKETQRIVGRDRLPIGSLPAQPLDRPDNELPLLLIQGKTVAGEEELEENINHRDATCDL